MELHPWLPYSADPKAEKRQSVGGGQPMSHSIYANERAASSEDFAARNIVTVARALNNKRLSKVINVDGSSIPYDNAYRYKFFGIQCETLLDLAHLVKVLLWRPHSCLIRGVAKDDSITGQRRLLYTCPKTKDPPTIVEQPQNWFALDIDGYGEASGNLRYDTTQILLALGLDHTQCFAIPSASYMIKKGIRIRLFFWNSMRISCLALKKYFTKVVDPALFHPIQPIYTARPTFVGMKDPAKQMMVWITGQQQYTEISDVVTNIDGSERKYTKKQAEAFRQKKIYELWSTADGYRHNALYGVCILLGKLIEQELLDEEEIIDELMDKCAYYWRGDSKRDHQTIIDGLKRGKLAMESADEF